MNSQSKINKQIKEIIVNKTTVTTNYKIRFLYLLMMKLPKMVYKNTLSIFKETKFENKTKEQGTVKINKAFLQMN